MKCMKFKENYLKVKKSNFLRGIYEIKKLEPTMFPLTIFYGIVSAIYPFISIYGISIIVDDLIMNKDDIYIHIFILLIVNTLFYTLNNILHRCFFSARRILFIKEKEVFTNTVINLKKTNYNSNELKKLCSKENSIMKHQSNNPLFMICKLIYDFISGFTNIFLTFLIVSRLFFVYDNQYFITSGYFSIVIVFITLVMIILVGVTSAIISKKTSKTNSDLIKSLNKFDYYWDYFNDFETGKSIRIFNGVNLIIKSVKKSMEKDTFRLLDKKSGYLAKQGAIVATIGSLLAFFVYLLIGYKCYIGLFSIGELTRYINGFMQIIQGGMLIANGVGQIIYLNNNLKYYFRLIDMNDINNIARQIQTNTISEISEIEFRNVYYKYENTNNYALKNLNLKINNDEQIAIVGENGAGKTTFIKLLLGIYVPTSGTILVNGIDLRTIKNDDYIKHFSTMFQDFFLPGFSINEIITGNKDNICEESVLVASDCSSFLKNINLTEAYMGNEYNPNGINFSGGEKQKIAFARALNKNCKFYILDEPSSAMDAISEYNFYSSINKYLKYKCIIYISHRLFSCICSDRILVFHNGALIEDNSFNNLKSNTNSKFNELWNKHLEQYKGEYTSD